MTERLLTSGPKHKAIRRSHFGENQRISSIMVSQAPTLHPEQELDLARAVEELKRELDRAHRREVATAEVLKAITVSDLQSVFDRVVESATRLCGADHAYLFLRESTFLRFAAGYDHVTEVSANHREFFMPLKVPIDRSSTAGRAALEARFIEIPDIREDPEYTLGEAQRIGSWRATLGAPLLRKGEVIGVVFVGKSTPGPFATKQIELVKTFADQAVIAIENTRLHNELRDSVQQQTATANVLGVISRSAFDLKPVFATVAESVVRLCEADRAFIFRFDGELLRAVATFNVSREFRDWVEKNPIRPNRHSATGRAALERRTIHIPDVLADQDYTYGAKDVENVRTNLGVPILKDDKLLGVILIFRLEVQPFTDKQIALVETFADQAAIAIENTRLFEEAQARTRELQEALKQQTATANVLKVISRSAFDLQPVLQTLVENAVKLGAASWGHIYRFDGESFRNIADYGASREVIEFWQKTPLRPGRGSGAGRAAVERRTVHIPDILADAEYQYAEAQKSRGVRSLLAVPMLRGNTLTGVFALLRTEVRPFSQSEIELVETFADQAVIAIENTSLFEEVRERNRDLTALSEVGRAVSSTLDLKMVLKAVVERAVDLSATDAGSIFYYREKTSRFELGETVGLDEAIITSLRKLDIAARHSGLGEAITQRKPLHIPDLTKRESNPLRAASIEAGFRAALIVPLLSSDGPLGTLVLQRRKPGEFPEAIVSLMQSFADQSAIALENARLFHEIAEKSRELEIASQHKSQFVANMSHELRTPLAAILGYAELMQEGFYEPQGPKSLDALTRIHSNGKHLLGLINTVLDIAKIESGQFTLNMAEYAIENVVETVRAATESLAQNKKLVLKAEVAKSLPVGLGDEQRLTQVLLNLVGNAIKFTDAGEVRVSAKALNGQFNVSVTDTGPGIPVEHQARIFEQFHQVDSSNTKAKSGTGLGLAIAKQIVEMHGGRIWVESTLGKGSTFLMELPTRAEFCKLAP
jgi:GAF domain-containing protein/anti-sigma regulatory factor (Ser/Thr protein kinase)